MSSWEVSAFVSEDGFAAEDLRRAVVARALVTTALEQAKETGNATGLERSLTIARVEVSRLQERVEAAKQAKGYRSGGKSRHQHQAFAFRAG